MIFDGGIFHIGSKNKIHHKGKKPDYNNLVPSSEIVEIERMKYVNWQGNCLITCDF